MTEDFSALKLMAVTMHEVFLELQGAGFTEEQAIRLVADMARSN